MCQLNALTVHNTTVTLHRNFTFTWPCIVTNLFTIKTNRRTNFQIYSGKELYMFRAVSLPILRNYALYIRHWHMLYRFDDILRAGCRQISTEPEGPLPCSQKPAMYTQLWARLIELTAYHPTLRSHFNIIRSSTTVFQLIHFVHTGMRRITTFRSTTGRIYYGGPEYRNIIIPMCYNCLQYSVQ